MIARNIWRPLGRLQTGAAFADWARSHATNPTALPLGGGVVRIFFSTRDADKRSSIASIDVGLDGTRVEVLGVPRGPLLSPGPRGAFDADGLTVGCAIVHAGKLYLYYLGWTVLQRVPFTNFIGLALGDAKGEAFERFSPAPIVGRSRENPLTLGYPWVLRVGGGWRMWFGSHLEWGREGLEMTHVLKEARSTDLVTWTQLDRPVIGTAGIADPAEFAVSRPTVVRERDKALSMWYARRRPSYELGYAYSGDGGETWQRHDAGVIFSREPEGWESQERTYPCVFDHAGARYMLYNGNGYGREGFGIALLDSDS